MPHLVMLYTPQLDAECNMDGLCRKLADAMLGVRDETGAQVFPTAGTRVLAYPAAHHAVADSRADYAFMYFNVRMGRGRSATVHQAIGHALSTVIREQLGPLLAARPLGLTLQIDEGHEVFDAKLGNLHALFAAKQ